MCTTACMQVGMALLCGQLDLCSASLSGAAFGSSSSSKDPVVDTLNWCMGAASTVHGRLESILNFRDQREAAAAAAASGTRRTAEARFHSQPSNRMVSVNELVNLLGINLAQLGMRTEELFVCSRGLQTRVKVRSNRESTTALKYEAESCFVSLGHVPICMELDRGRVCLAFFTASCHTVCAACYTFGKDYDAASQAGPVLPMQRPLYAFFDPSPGQLQVGISGAHMVRSVQNALGIPVSLCSQVKYLRQMAEHTRTNPPDLWKQRKKKISGEEIRRVQWAANENEDGVLVGTTTDKCCAGEKGGEESEDDFQCDVTLMYMA